MLDPVSTIAASTIVNLAFQKFVEARAGKLAEQFREAAIAKVEVLRQRIVVQLRGKSGKLDEALVRVEQGDREALATITKHLGVAMEKQPAFA